MEIDVISLFPEMIKAVTDHGITHQAIGKGALTVRAHNPREHTLDRHRSADDRPYGGGPGMLMMAEPLCRCIDSVRKINSGKLIYLSPQGQRLTQSTLAELAAQRSLVLMAGRYEGIDERVISSRVNMELSIGDYVLAGGEVPAMVLIEGISRLLPGVLGNCESAENDSFSDSLLDHPHYTRPEVFENMQVPAVLLSGDHEKIRLWRLKQSLKRTRSRRPDLLTTVNLTDEQIRLLKELDSEQDDEQDNSTD